LVAILKSSLAKPPTDTTAEDVFAAIVLHPASSKPLRMALSAQLEMADVKAIIELASAWFDAPEETSRPPLRDLVGFLTCLIDAHFVALLQDDLCHSLIQSLNASLASTIQVTQDWVALKGPIDNVERELKRSLATDGAPLEIGEYTVEVLDI
jgi:hypothetical protein